MPTKIEWATETWNPVVGCRAISQGCQNCYAARMAARELSPKYRGLTRDGKWTGEIRVSQKEMSKPWRWRKPRRVFVCSMGDLFAGGVPERAQDDVWLTMAKAPQHTFMVLTKRPEQLAEFLARPRYKDGPLPNVWLGTTLESGRHMDRAYALARVPAARRFISYEPAVGPLRLGDHTINIPWAGGEANGGRNYSMLLSCFDLVIAGGESGPGARPPHPNWFRTVRDDCERLGVGFFFKQWGRHAPWVEDEWTDRDGTERFRHVYVNADGSWGQASLMADEAYMTNYTGTPDATAFIMAPVGKKKAGRLLDGKEWSQIPEPVGSEA